ncbi:MAG: hypothetical protein PHY72_04255 [Candidatus Pacebacteria bacterium]|nr:hypothetical protein [Candidatus Paceibacterota bacterium]
MLPFDGSGSRTLLLKDYPGILINNNGEYLVEVHIIVANGNKYELQKIAVDSLVGDDIIVPLRIRRSIPIQRSIFQVIYNGPIVYDDGGYCDDWYYSNAYWAWRRAYYRTIVVPYYPIYTYYYCPPTVTYVNQVVRYNYDHIVVINNVEQLRARRHKPEVKFRSDIVDSRKIFADHGYAGIFMGKNGDGKGYQTKKGATLFSRQDQVRENIKSFSEQNNRPKGSVRSAPRDSGERIKSSGSPTSAKSVNSAPTVNPGFFTKIRRGVEKAGGSVVERATSAIVVTPRSYGRSAPAPVRSSGESAPQKHRSIVGEQARTQLARAQQPQPKAQPASARIETRQATVEKSSSTKQSSSSSSSDDDEQKKHRRGK